jgi:hypothetical protein
VNFSWAKSAKFFLILWRDILFEQQKAQLLNLDQLVQPEDLVELSKTARLTIKNAFAELQEMFVKAQKKTIRKRQNLSAQWELQQNPWSIYKTQLQRLADQSEQLYEKYKILFETATHFNEIEKLVLQTEDFCRAEVTNIKQIAARTIDEIKQEQRPKMSKIALHLEELEEGISLPHHFNSFTNALEEHINEILGKAEIPVQVRAGLVDVKELDIKRSTKQWLEAEILPLLYEIWELTENAHNSLKMALVNIKNRAILLGADENEESKIEFDLTAIFLPLHTFRKNIQPIEKGLDELGTLIDERLKHDFNISAIYQTNQEFLPVPLQSATLNQFRQSRGQLFNRLSIWSRKQWEKIQNIRHSVEKEDALSNSEKIVRLIQSRSGVNCDKNYTSIFLTKGYIGESFVVGRKQELNHLKTIINNWKSGFRGAVVITGQRLSGKTILGELVAGQFFENSTIRLAPNTLIKLNGRRLMTTFDLGEALNFIGKYATNEPPMIWIDDLELWWDKDIPLNKNVRNLRKFIDNNASRLFFLVSMSNWLKAHLNLFLETSKVFQAEINVDRMSAEEIGEAILMRHGATHKNLLDEDGEVLDSQQYQKLINRIYRSTEGNIGEALNRWAAAIYKKEGDDVIYHEVPKYSLPDFISPDDAILLTSIMMEKRTSEYRLRKLYGPAFTDKYAAILQRLISIGVLKRELDDWLEIEEALVNDLGRLLETKKYLSFNRKINTKT